MKCREIVLLCELYENDIKFIGEYGSMLKVPSLLFLLFISSSSIFGQEIQFQFPLHGVQGKDFFISNYVDHDTSKGILDPFCGKATYDGHKGTDISLKGFKQMDSGVVVYAAADGKVVGLHDGEFDRNKHWEKGRVWNFVAIKHVGGYVSYYGHLRKFSILVSIGDTIKAGQPIGLVGSSGYSSGPHLHFEVRRNDTIFEPFDGPCHRKKSMWASQLNYDTTVYAVDKGFVPYVPFLDTVRDGYLATDTFYSNDTTACFWAAIHGLKEDDSLRTEWYDTRAELWHLYATKIFGNPHWIQYSWSYVNAKKMPERKGVWTIKFYVNKRLVTTSHFYMDLRKRKKIL